MPGLSFTTSTTTRVKQTQQQTTKLSPQQKYSMRILQLPIQDLKQEINDKFEQNPLMKITNPREFFCGEFENYQNTKYNDTDAEERRQFKIDSIAVGQSVYAALCEQLECLLTPDENEPIYRGCHIMVCNIDDDGYLTISDEDIAEQAGISLEQAQEAVRFFQQNVVPAGIGARDLRENLLLQLERQGKKNSIAWKMLADCFEEMQNHQLQEIADKLDVEIEKIEAEMKYLSTLNMAPAASLDTQQTIEYIQPDVKVVRMPDKTLDVLPIDDLLPQIEIDTGYIERLKIKQKGTLPKEAQDKINAYTQEIKQLQNDLEFRNDTTLKVAKKLVDRQPEFFTRKGKILPLLQKDLANELELANSTISRAINSKYMMLPDGKCIPFSTLVERQAGNNECTQKDIQDKIQELLSQGSLSDQKITNCLQQQGFKISRRAVNKYRHEMGIAASSPHKPKAFKENQ